MPRAESTPRTAVIPGGWCLYVLRCGDGSLYTGITNDLRARLLRHASGLGARYTRGRGPFVLVYREPCADRPEASRREHAMKALARDRKQSLCAVPLAGPGPALPSEPASDAEDRRP